ncbi:S24 family peptidase [Devosia algicola]|uniref:S24 family peptidase n=1 Tax=Devosia algicola TaxID=3026418 RepID=A0ABY7YST0_9HYPH|nr:S24 family peptidase [Devosia algicola]WDR04247.1 S24 family peptidase [Devosia algicola]
MIRAILKRQEWTQMRVADRLGVSQSTVNRWIKGADPEGRHRDAIRDFYAEIFGDFSASPKAIDRQENTSRIPDLAIFGGLGNGGFLDVTVDESGDFADPEHLRGYWTFPDYMVRAFRNMSNIYAWEVRGDSMDPTLSGGSVVFVDTKQNALPPNDIYALDYGDGLVVKRLKLIPRTDRIMVISDNERYGADELLRSDVHVYGRIVGWFQWR